eukprot:g3312.t1
MAERFKKLEENIQFLADHSHVTLPHPYRVAAKAKRALDIDGGSSSSSSSGGGGGAGGRSAKKAKAAAAKRGSSKAAAAKGGGRSASKSKVKKQAPPPPPEDDDDDDEEEEEEEYKAPPRRSSGRGVKVVQFHVVEHEGDNRIVRIDELALGGESIVDVDLGQIIASGFDEDNIQASFVHSSSDGVTVTGGDLTVVKKAKGYTKIKHLWLRGRN